MIQHRRGIRGLGRAAMRLEAGGRPKQRGRLVLRDARTQRPCCRTRAPCALLRTRAVQHTAPAALCRAAGRSRISRCQTAYVSSFPRRIFAPGLLLPVHTRPEPRGGRSAGRRGISFVALVRRDATLAGSAARTPYRQDANRQACRRRTRPGPPRGAVTSRGPRDATSPRSAVRIVSGGRPSMSGMRISLAQPRYVVNNVVDM